VDGAQEWGMNLRAGLWSALQRVRIDERMGPALLKMLFHISLADRQRQLYDLLLAGGVLGTKGIAKEMGIEENHVMNLVRSLKKIGCVRKVIGGYEADE